MRVQEHDHDTIKDGKGSHGWNDMYKGTCTREDATEGHKDDGKDDSAEDGKQGAGTEPAGDADAAADDDDDDEALHAAW